MAFNGFFPSFIIIIIVGLGLWGFYDMSRFTRPDGGIKRGVKIGSAPLAWETSQLLETLPRLTRYNRSFILIKGREALIAAERPFWQIGRRDRRIPLIGYVNLNEPENCLEFRMPLSVLVTSIFITFVVLIFAANLFMALRRDLLGFTFLWLLLPLLFLVAYIGALLRNYYHERNHLLDILGQAREQKSI
jgi:hypothetical protein